MQFFLVLSKTEMYRQMLVKVANIKHYENPFSGLAFLHVDTLTDAVKELRTLLQLLPVNTPTVSLSPK